MNTTGGSISNTLVCTRRQLVMYACTNDRHARIAGAGSLGAGTYHRGRGRGGRNGGGAHFFNSLQTNERARAQLLMTHAVNQCERVIFRSSDSRSMHLHRIGTILLWYSGVAIRGFSAMTRNCRICNT